MQFEVHVYQTYELSNRAQSRYGDSDAVKYIVADYMESAFAKNWNNHSVSVVMHGDVVAPTQNKNGSFTTTSPCYPIQADYSSLIRWWIDYVDCATSVSGDCALLITDGNGGGGTIQDYYSIACHGIDIPNAYGDYGSGSGFGQMQTVFHEVGHALLGDEFTTEEEHNMGNVYQQSGEPYRTPMGHGGSVGQNFCGSSVDDHTTENEAMYYDTCAALHFDHTN